MKVLNNLQPNNVFKYFEDICNIPHGSYNLQAISDYCVDFAMEHGLTYYRDTEQNVIIYKEASPDMVDAPTLTIQGHLDMVCEKNQNVEHDFFNEPLYLQIDGDYISANGTTLGGDDGIAVAMALAILEDEHISHPRLEVVFTTNEETGMEGAMHIDASKISGRYMLNLDSEDEGRFTVGCAGGVTLEPRVPISYEYVRGNLCNISITGLKGGHSGVDIDKNRANAIKVLGEILSSLIDGYGINLVSVSGGIKNNAIPREASATFIVASEYYAQCQDTVNRLIKDISDRLQDTEPDFKVSFNLGEVENVSCYDNITTFKIINLMDEIINGIVDMNEDIPKLVETSLNFGVLKQVEDYLSCEISLRSADGDKLAALQMRVCELCDKIDILVKDGNPYPGWKYNKASALKNLMIKCFKEVYDKEPIIETIHAGLECGIFADKIEGIDIVSTGPDILDIHTPKERLSISSVQRTWKYLLHLLKNFNEI